MALELRMNGTAGAVPFTSTGPVSVSFWYSRGQSTISASVISNSVTLVTASGDASLSFGGFAATSPKINPYAWNHVVGIFNTNVRIGYLNGVQVVNSTGTFTAPGFNTPRLLTAQVRMAQVAFWKELLTESDVMNLFAGDPTLLLRNSVMGNYPMNNVVRGGRRIDDVSGRMNHSGLSGGNSNSFLALDPHRLRYEPFNRRLERMAMGVAAATPQNPAITLAHL